MQKKNILYLWSVSYKTQFESSKDEQIFVLLIRWPNITKLGLHVVDTEP